MSSVDKAVLVGEKTQRNLQIKSNMHIHEARTSFESPTMFVSQSEYSLAGTIFCDLIPTLIGGCQHYDIVHLIRRSGKGKETFSSHTCKVSSAMASIFFDKSICS